MIVMGLINRYMIFIRSCIACELIFICLLSGLTRNRTGVRGIGFGFRLGLGCIGFRNIRFCGMFSWWMIWRFLTRNCRLICRKFYYVSILLLRLFLNIPMNYELLIFLEIYPNTLCILWNSLCFGVFGTNSRKYWGNSTLHHWDRQELTLSKVWRAADTSIQTLHTQR